MQGQRGPTVTFVLFVAGKMVILLGLHYTIFFVLSLHPLNNTHLSSADSQFTVCFLFLFSFSRFLASSLRIQEECEDLVMAGMLPGVECARRRRFHQGGGGGSVIKQVTRSISESQPEKSGNNKLNEAALEARERLEDRLRASSSSLNKGLDRYLQRHLKRDCGNTHERERHGINNRVFYASLITEISQEREHVRKNAKPSSVGLSKDTIYLLRRDIYTPPKTEGKPLSKLLSRTSEQDECPICLDCFQHNQAIIHLPCCHKFHSNCLISWLEKDNHCPYCRAKVSNKPS